MYEDFVTHEAVIHRGDCRHRNHGHGRGAGRNERENTWHGEFSSEQSARAAKIDSRSYLRDCRIWRGALLESARSRAGVYASAQSVNVGTG